MSDWIVKALASCFFISYAPARIRPGSYHTGAGLLGTAFGLLTLPLLPMRIVPQIIVLLAGFFVSVIISGRAEAILGMHDDPRIVIDEWIGCWITLAFLPRRAVVLVLGFILFRVFDVWKPWLIRKSAELPGGWGIVMDDVLAGVAANLILQVAVHLHPL